MILPVPQRRDPSAALPRKKKQFLPARHLTTSQLTTSHLSKRNRINKVNMKDRNGWDGKLRVDDQDNRRAVLANPEALEDPDYSDEDAPPIEEIGADEGSF